jgi:negative regulator of flagellin synthesis FlgM
MEITSKNQLNRIEAYMNQVQAKPKTEEPAEKDARQQVGSPDTVVISDAAKRVLEARVQLDSIPETRSDKVAEIKGRIENGTYVIQPDKIADKMIRESLLNDFMK